MFSFLRQPTTWHCSQLLLSAGRAAVGPTAANSPQERASAKWWDRQTDRGTDGHPTVTYYASSVNNFARKWQSSGAICSQFTQKRGRSSISKWAFCVGDRIPCFECGWILEHQIGLLIYANTVHATLFPRGNHCWYTRNANRAYVMCQRAVNRTRMYSENPRCLFTHTIRYHTRSYFNVRSKASVSQLNLLHWTKLKRWKREPHTISAQKCGRTEQKV